VFSGIAGQPERDTVSHSAPAEHQKKNPSISRRALPLVKANKGKETLCLSFARLAEIWQLKELIVDWVNLILDGYICRWTVMAFGLIVRFLCKHQGRPQEYANQYTDDEINT
jgi:hypothetical protein